MTKIQFFFFAIVLSISFAYENLLSKRDFLEAMRNQGTDIRRWLRLQWYWWPKCPKPSTTFESFKHYISSPTSVTNIDVTPCRNSLKIRHTFLDCKWLKMLRQRKAIIPPKIMLEPHLRVHFLTIQLILMKTIIFEIKSEFLTMWDFEWIVNRTSHLVKNKVVVPGCGSNSGPGEPFWRFTDLKSRDSRQWWEL